MGEPQNPHFYDFGIFERVRGSQHQLCLSLETPGHLTKNQEILERFEDIIFISKLWKPNQHLYNVRKGGRRKSRRSIK